MLKQKGIANSLQARVGGTFSKFPISPNAWTFLSLLIACAGFVALAHYRSLPAFLFLFILSGALDMVDGAVARARKQATKKGAFIDGIADRAVEFLFLASLLYYGIPAFLMPGSYWLFFLLFFGTCMTSFAKAYASHTEALSNEAARKMPGLLERAERLALLFAGVLIAILLQEPAYITYAVSLAATLSLITLVQRIYFTLQKAK